MKKKLFTFFLVASLVGCQSVPGELAYKQGTNVTQGQVKLLKLGNKQKFDVLLKFGQPQVISFGKNNNEIFEYHYQQTNSENKNLDQTVKFYFNSMNRIIETKTIKGSHFKTSLTEG